MNEVYEKTNYSNINSIPSINVMNKVGNAFGKLRARLYRYVLNTDANKMVEIESKIKEAQDELSYTLKGYDSLVSD